MKGGPRKLDHEWATKTQQDGTIMRVSEMKEFSDGQIEHTKPEGWAWDDRPVTRPSHIKELQQDPGWHGGPNTVKRRDGTEEILFLASIEELEADEEEYFLLTKVNDWSMIETKRCDSYRILLEYKSAIEKKLPDASTAGMLVNRTVNGNSVVINVNSTTQSNTSESVEEFENGTSVVEDDSSFKDEVELFVKINNDSLKISCEMEEASKKNVKDYIFREKTTTTIKGENYGSSSDFFKKLSELNIVTVRTLDTEEYNLYFALPL